MYELLFCRRLALSGLAVAALIALPACVEPQPAVSPAAASQETAPEKAEAHSQPGYWAYVDAQGNLVPRPADVSAPKTPSPTQVSEQFASKSAAGGMGMRYPFVVYSYATVSQDGGVQVKCVTGPRDGAIAAGVAEPGGVAECTHSHGAATAKEGE